MSHGVFAQQIPSAGSQMQQIPPAPQALKPPPQVTLAPPSAAEPSAAANATAAMKIVVRQLHIAGATAFPEAQLLAVSGFVPSSELTLADLRACAARIAAFYHRNGYVLAQAYLPQQEIKDGIVTIAVLDGRYGKVVLRNTSRVSDNVAHGLLDGLDEGAVITIEPLEHRLLLLSDLPGVQVRSTLVPGAAPGSADLVVDLAPGRQVAGSIDADNAGNRYTGAARIGATVSLNEPAGQGDVATLRVLTSGSGLNYARLAYQAQVGKTTVGAAYSALRYALQREFSPLDAHGTAQVASIFAGYPLIRSRATNLTAQIDIDAKRYEDKVGATASVADKTAHVFVASLAGDHRDGLLGGGFNNYGVAWSAGTIDVQTPLLRAVDALSAQTDGHYDKLSFNAARSQRVTDDLSLYAAVNGQRASKNLDVSEKMELGGMYGVRAYPEGEAYADQGYVLNVEARLALARFVGSMRGQMQLIGFIDHGSVSADRNPWTAGDNHRSLSGAGIGLSWFDNNNLSVRAYYAHKVGNAPALSAPDSASRFWLQAVKYF